MSRTSPVPGEQVVQQRDGRATASCRCAHEPRSISSRTSLTLPPRHRARSSRAFVEQGLQLGDGAPLAQLLPWGLGFAADARRQVGTAWAAASSVCAGAAQVRQSHRTGMTSASAKNRIASVCPAGSGRSRPWVSAGSTRSSVSEYERGRVRSRGHGRHRRSPWLGRWSGGRPGRPRSGVAVVIGGAHAGGVSTAVRVFLVSHAIAVRSAVADMLDRDPASTSSARRRRGSRRWSGCRRRDRTCWWRPGCCPTPPGSS